MSNIADKILSRIKTKPDKKQMPTSDLMMIAEELVSALTDDNRDGVADALRAAFGCMSSDKAKNYAEGGMVDDEEDEDKVKEDEINPYSGKPSATPVPKPEAEKTKPLQWESNTDDESMVYTQFRDGYEEHEWDEREQAENDAVYDRNVNAIGQIAAQTGSHIGQDINEDLMDTLIGDPKKYVEVRSNPEAYDKFLKAYQKAFDERDPVEGMDIQPVYDMLYDPEFWKSLKTQSFNDETQYRLAQQQLAQSNQLQLTPEQRAAYDAQRAASEGRKPELVELRDPNRNVTVLTDKPAKALRRQPALKVVPKKPAAKPTMPRSIQMGPLR